MPRAKQHLRILEVELCVICFSKLGIHKTAIVLALLFAAHAASADVLKIVVDDTIHPITAEYVDRAIQEAQRTHADALLFELNTPGGIMGPMERIIQKILASPGSQ